MYVAALPFGAGADSVTIFFSTHQFSAAAYLIFLAMLFDALDGRLARFTRHTTDFGGQLDRRYGTSHFIHTWADLAGLRFDGFDSSKSLISKDFKERPLLVGDPASQKSLIDLRTLMPAKQ